MVMASSTLGHLARAGGTLTADFVEFEVKRALEWLQEDRHDSKRLAAVLLLKEMAANAPTLFFVHVAEFFDVIWLGLRDKEAQIREMSIDALHEGLMLIANRDGRLRTQLYQKLYNQAMVGMNGNNESIHGSLLVLGEMVGCTEDYMKFHFKEVCEIFMDQTKHGKSMTKRTVITLLPVLGAYSPDTFVKAYLQPSMVFLTASAKNTSDRSICFIALGEMAIAVGDNIEPYLDALIDMIKEAIVPKKKTYCPEAFVCISLLAKAVGTGLSKHVGSLLDCMFASTLSQGLTYALKDLAAYIPELLSAIQKRLLDRLSLILTDSPYKMLGTPSSSSSSTLKDIKGKGRVSLQSANTTSAGDTLDAPTVTLALKTLGSFDFLGHNLTEFVRDHVMNFLDDDVPQIRKEAAITCSRLLVQSSEKLPTRGHLALLVSEVLEKLLAVGIADPDPSIRGAVLRSLHTKYDSHLAQAENLRSLFIALNDEVFENRVLAISVIGRLTMRNPAYVMPSLRKTLIQLLTELEYGGDSRVKEESAQLIGHLIRAAKKLIKPYVDPILKALLPKLQEGNSAVASCVLASLGELALVGGDSMMLYLDQLLPIIINTLQDQSSVLKREIALRTLSKLVSSTGYVIEPYNQYPALLDIILKSLTSETSPTVRREIIKVIGTIGAQDPYKHKLNSLAARANASQEQNNSVQDDQLLASMTPSSDDYYPTVVIMALMRILRDPSLQTHHKLVIQAVMYIFQSLGMKCVPFLPQIMPAFLGVMRSCDDGFREFLFQQLGKLVSIVKQHIRGYLDDIFALVQKYWHSSLLIHIIVLVEEISNALKDEFKVYLPNLIPQMLTVLLNDRSEKHQPTLRVLRALETFGNNLEDYLHLVIPAVVKLVEQVDAPLNVRLNAVRTLCRLCRKLNIADYASRIIHPLARVLFSQYEDLRNEAILTLCALILQLQSDYAIFVPMVNKIMTSQRISHSKYERLVTKLLKNQPLPSDIFSDQGETASESSSSSSEDLSGLQSNDVKKLHVNQLNLKKAWEAEQRSTREDWMEWMRRFSVELLRESPSPTLRSCSALAQVYPPLARELFNASFVSCWTELFDQFQDELVKSLETAMTSENIPPEILQALLNLAEFMEHDDKPLPIQTELLGHLAETCNAYAKALHYKEIEFHNNHDPETIEALISINNQLQLSEAAVGVLLFAQEKQNVELKESWYEKLNRWDEALDGYETKQMEEPLNLEYTLGRMRCLNALGEWERLAQLTQDTWRSAESESRVIIAPMAAAAAWNLGRWDSMEYYLEEMPETAVDGAFYRALLHLHHNDFEQAEQFINRTRNLLDTKLTALVAESYQRAYIVTVRVQQLSEMEEMISYKTGDEERQTMIRRMWVDRLHGCQRNLDVWQSILSVRSLVMTADQDRDIILEMSDLCLKSGRNKLALKFLRTLFDDDPSEVGSEDPLPTAHPATTFGYLKHIWAIDNREEAFSRLKAFVDVLENDEGRDASLLASAYLKLGSWQLELQEDQLDNEEVVENVLVAFGKATNLENNSYDAWHAWAMMNYDVVSHRHSQLSPAEITEDVTGDETVVEHLTQAVRGFFRSISLNEASCLQDTLRLLTLWFKYGEYPKVESMLKDGFNTVSIDTWLEVIPQIIARVHSSSLNVRRMIHELLTNVGKEHPQALVYPLTVASKSQSQLRRQIALSIMEGIDAQDLIEQALLVSEELIRVAILWHEMWHEALEESSRLYFGDKNVEAMFQTLAPLHDLLDAGPITLHEVSFQQAYGRDLTEAQEWCKKYSRSGKVADLNQAWDLYYHVFRRINKQLPQLVTLELQYVSPALLNVRDMDLAMPGTYSSNKHVKRIKAFQPNLQVITSKQRPRKIGVDDSDGVTFNYLLKGHEDLRQDERVMQLFGLVNTLLQSDQDASQRHLAIKRYAVTPLSPNSGLIGWLPNCDTLHSLIKEHREQKKIVLNIEHRLMLQMAPNYDNLPLLNKVEVFQYALDNSSGQDLYKVLWLKSRNSEAWLDRRTNYTRSLSLMSMVGYMLGLGDRHPSNLMMDRGSGKVVHIDFGDCFEVAMHREKFPERIPFRLTRMMINAMEVSGIEGNYRSTCESVMTVLRENKDSLMAVLEAFVHDPLLNWRLLATDDTPSDASGVNDDDDEEEGHDEEEDEESVGMTERMGTAQTRGRAASDASETAVPEVLNERAVEVISRISAKLSGRDFDDGREVLPVRVQVGRLINQATSDANLCQCYVGWCPFW
eukprot:TRINITY_DN2025_c0_g1_i1.p1 TRINITY_DN2025_c0_g1~~TRINITY_DN2025_c0_g1_i1.p1  ORF type:complete len:2240 (+),score=782.23 TRINITY_DN2025_c0_g1_i1:702-7421(+)